MLQNSQTHKQTFPFGFYLRTCSKLHGSYMLSLYLSLSHTHYKKYIAYIFMIYYNFLSFVKST